MTEFEYDQSVFNARKTFFDYKAKRERYMLEAQTAQDQNQKHRLSYGAWMCGRRMSDYSRFVECQEKGIHEVAFIVNDHLVCTCGLINPTVGDDTNRELRRAFLKGPGHWEHRDDSQSDPTTYESGS